MISERSNSALPDLSLHLSGMKAELESDMDLVQLSVAGTPATNGSGDCGSAGCGCSGG